MPVSLRKFRAIVATYTDTGSDGVVSSTYTKSASSDSDGLWWCAKGVPSGRETTTGMKADERIDAVLEFSAQAPVQRDCLVEIDSQQYMVRSVLRRDYGRDELQVLAEFVSGRPYTIAGA